MAGKGSSNMNNADIQLLFGVLGGGELSGESGKLIKKQLSGIVKQLNGDPLKVKVSLDTEKGGKKSWSSQLNEKLKKLSTNNKFTVGVSKINIKQGAVTDFKRQLNSVINTLNLDKGVSITLTSKDIGEIKKEFKEASNGATEAARKIAEFKVQMESLNTLKGAVHSSLSSLSKTSNNEEEISEITKLTHLYEQWSTKIEAVRADKNIISDEYKAELEAEGAAIRQNILHLKQRREETKKTAKENNNAASSESKYYTQLNKVNNAILQAKKNLENWTAAKNGKTSGDYTGIEKEVQNLESLRDTLLGLKEPLGDFDKRFGESNRILKGYNENIINAHKNTKTFTERMGGLASKFSAWLSVSQIIMALYRALKQMVTAVIEVDTAMTELRKVTNETEGTYSKFIDTAIRRSKELGSTISDTITASADFARLGYSLDETSSLADAAIVYKNVGDGINDITSASESIISTMKAFGVEAEDAMFIVDKFNEVGNNFAISSKGVGDALLRSASALAAGNNTLDESIALITAANSTVQDADVVGTTLKTVSMYLRAAKTEAEQAGESTDGMANSVSELRGELLELTGNRVDIQIDETTFKSTYQIIKELSEVWDNLHDVDRSNILELIGGKRNANVLSSLINNFETAEKVIEKAANATGSALIENEKYLESVGGAISHFKATFEGLSVTLIDSELIEQIIGWGTGLLNVLNIIAKLIDTLGGLNSVLITTAGIVVTIKLKEIGELFKGVLSPIRSIIGSIKEAKSAGISAGKFISNAFTQATASATGLQLALGALTIAYTVIAGVVNAVKRAQEAAAQQAEENYKNLVEESKEAAKTKKTLKELIDRYKDLAEASKGAWSTDKMIEVKNIQLEIAEINSGDIANSLDLVNGKLDEEYAKLLAIYNLETQRSLAASESEYYAAKQRAESDYKSNNHWAGGAVEDDNLTWWFIEQAFSKLHNTSSDTARKWWANEAGETYAWASRNVSTALENIGSYEKGYEKLIEWRDMLLKADLPHDTSEALSYLNAKIIEFKSVLDEAQEAKERFFADKATTEALDYIATYGIKSQKDFVQYIQGILDDDTLEDGYAKIAIETVGSLLPKYTIPDDIKKQLLTDAEALSAEIRSKLTSADNNTGKAIGSWLDSMDLSNYQSFLAWWEVNKDSRVVTQDLNALQSAFTGYLDRVKKTFGDLDVYTTNINKFKDTINTLKSASNEYKNMGSVSSDTYKKVISLGEDYADLFDFTNGKIEIQNDALDKHVEKLIQEYGAILATSGATEDQIQSLYRYGSALVSVNEDTEVAVDSLKPLVEILSDVRNGTSYSSIEIIKLLEQYPILAGSIIETAEGYAIEEQAVRSLIAQQTKLYKVQESIAKQAARVTLDKATGGSGKTAANIDAIFDKYGDSISSFDDYIIAWEKYFERSAPIGRQWPEEVREYVEASITEAKRLNEINKILEDLFNPSQYKFGTSEKSGKDDTESEFDKEYGKFKDYLNDKEHSIFLLEKNKADSSEIVNVYSEMLGAIEAQIQNYKATGLDENSDYIQELQNQWWGYKEAIEQIRQDEFNDYLNDEKFAIEKLKVDGASASEISHSYSAILKAINDEIEHYTSIGFDITDDVVQNLINEARNLEDEVISSLDEILDEAGSAVDDLQNVYDTLTAAADEYAEYGYITIDSLQSVIDLGVEYMAFLQDENGQLVINKENIQNVIAARTEQLAVESALNYVEQLRLALEANNTAELERLTYATNTAANATWGLVYANLALLDLEDSQYEAALNNIDNLRALADNAISNIGVSVSGTAQPRSEVLREELEARKKALREQKDALDEILDQTMELVKWEAEQQVEALEQQISDYEKIVDLKKEALEATKKEADYEDELAEKIEDIAKLQERINTLSLDDSREAQAEKITLEEELYELQKDLSDYQAEHMLGKHESTLNDMASAYADEKQKEIDAVEESVSSTEKIYQLAIERINNDWNGLYQDLLTYNYEYGNTLQDDLVSAWDAASEAVQRYGNYVEAVSQIAAEIEAADNTIISAPSGTTNIGTVNKGNIEAEKRKQVSSLVNRMKTNSAAWWNSSESKRSELSDENLKIAGQIEALLGQKLVRGDDGVWYVGSVGGDKKLYDCYHQGGVVGGLTSMKKNETLALLENGELVLTDEHQKSLYRLVDFATTLSDRFGKLIESTGYSHLFQRRGTTTAEEVASLTNSKNMSIEFGDVYITGASDETVEKHREVNRQFVNDILKQLNIKR